METKPNEQTGGAKPLNAIEESKQLLEQIQKEKAELKEYVERAESVRAEQMLSGNASAGQAPVPPKEESDKDYAARVMSGKL